MDLTRASAVASRLLTMPECGSTNAELRERASDAVAWPHLSVLLTDSQTAGRGRLDRTWNTPPGAALAVSVLLRDLPAAIEARGWIPLAAGVAMTDAVSAQLPEHQVGLKWPNDVLVDGRKICGILAEVSGVAIIVGTGVNTAMTADQLPVPTATSFAALGVTADVDRLVTDYLARLDRIVRDLSLAGDAGSSGLHTEASERCLTLGQDVEVSLPDGRVLRGRAVRLEADGRLVVDDSSAAGAVEIAVASGDVVHARLV
ncbi:biotin--[acetyl-CoA-carboxylase] ligase [Microbacterium sp. H1-D42]|uniref:biotin--[acetyl-CoA-carboxylase] ligase n=1 Tax=Microbacterium sp. H1-D42 TaxID=2925844 RepID=UPI001F53C505|nr:biotin--[acetyl-CoA-carboxylase] ligase [Microbacterium sp. H1-D42]UNK69743.1 biotin--[acetyl-CoA-carboxylase] ligase [Microbacterium sp. H1-D42]